MEFVNFLKNPQQYLDLGAKIPKGAMLTGMVMSLQMYTSQNLNYTLSTKKRSRVACFFNLNLFTTINLYFYTSSFRLFVRV